MGDLDSAGVALGSLWPWGLRGSEVLSAVITLATQVPPPASTVFLGDSFSNQNC